MIQTFYCSENKRCESELSAEAIQKVLHEGRGSLWVDFFQATEEEQALLSQMFNFHPLAIEDCVNVRHHPKIDEYENYLYIILHAPDMRSETDRIKTKELDIFLGKNFIVTYHEHEIESIDFVKERFKKNAEGLLTKGPDFFLHTLVDNMMESYEPLVGDLEEEVNWAEDEVFCKPDNTLLKALFGLKKDILLMRRVMVPQKDTILQLSKEGLPFVSERARLYFRDTHDVMFRIMGLLDSYRDMVNTLVDAYFILDSNQANQVMKGLTVMTAIMLPLSVIVGIYGMNFEHMPEFKWRYGYFCVWAVMIATVVLMLLILKRKKWL